jgi:phosphatidylglycerophosphatase A
VSRLIASFFGSGLLLGRLRGSDRGSGTVGALVALVAALVLARWQAQLVALLAVTVGGWLSIRPFTASGTDPGWVVVDEAAGAHLATVGLHPLPALVAWLVFRLADVFKRAFPGVAAAESLPGATGVMADDLVAGLYGLAAGWLVQALS